MQLYDANVLPEGPRPQNGSPLLDAYRNGELGQYLTRLWRRDAIGQQPISTAAIPPTATASTGNNNAPVTPVQSNARSAVSPAEHSALAQAGYLKSIRELSDKVKMLERGTLKTVVFDLFAALATRLIQLIRSQNDVYKLGFFAMLATRYGPSLAPVVRRIIADGINKLLDKLLTKVGLRDILESTRIRIAYAIAAAASNLIIMVRPNLSNVNAPDPGTAPSDTSGAAPGSVFDTGGLYMHTTRDTPGPLSGGGPDFTPPEPRGLSIIPPSFIPSARISANTNCIADNSDIAPKLSLTRFSNAFFFDGLKFFEYLSVSSDISNKPFSFAL